MAGAEMLDERSIIKPAAVLPVQFWTGIEAQGTDSPEKSLMRAILKDALECCQRYRLYQDGRGQAIFRDAQEWIHSSSRYWPFSYLNICDSLGLNPNYIRRCMDEYLSKLS